jgi:hypothetical protein
MERNKLKIFFVTLFFIFIIPLLNAQEGSFFIDFSREQPVFIQRLVWEEEEYTLYYEVVIEVRDIFYRTHLRETTENNFIEISLPSGRYRFSVTAYDLFGIQGETSEWEEFEVIHAYQPGIAAFYPSGFFLDQNQERVLRIAGNNLTADTVFYLRPVPPEPSSRQRAGARPVVPVQQSETVVNENEEELFQRPYRVEIVDERLVNLHFHDQTLITGVYEIYAENPGGLHSSMGRFIIDYRKPLDLYFKVIYNPIIILPGEMSETLGKNVFLTGVTFAFEIISSRRSTFNGGLEIALKGYGLNPAFSFFSGFDDMWYSYANISDGFTLTSIDINIALQRRFNQGKAALSFRFGMGPSFLNGYGQHETNDITVHFNFGITGLFYLYDVFHLEVGADIMYCFVENPFGYVTPKLGFVWKF